jgi:RimJ/RimL family protein N-acetyltransferase
MAPSPIDRIARSLRGRDRTRKLPSRQHDERNAMPAPVTLRGPRVILRPWRLPEDLDPLFEINGDPGVMEYMLRTHDRAESDAWGRRMASVFDEYGYGFWVLELPGEGLAGVVGLMPVFFEASFTPATEIGWRVAARFQRRGLAEEGARLALDYAFGPAGLDQIVAFTRPPNEPSWRLMEKLGMRREQTFEHPAFAAGDPRATHCLYAIARAEWIGHARR